MQFNIRPLQEGDYENILCGWWRDWKWVPPVKDFLPEDGTGGYIVYDGDIPVCAGFMYTTNSRAVWCDWIISNIEYKERAKRKGALELLIDTVSKEAKKLDNKFIYALIKHQPLIDTYIKMGFIQGDSYSSEMIKII